jgi:hypothetical protein
VLSFRLTGAFRLTGDSSCGPGGRSFVESRHPSASNAMPFHLPPNDVLLALLLATILLAVASGIDMPSEDDGS